MPRRQAFSFSSFDIHVQPSLRRALPMSYGEPDRCFELLLSERLDALKRIFDSEAGHGQAAAAS